MISIFSPFHRNDSESLDYLLEAFLSIKSQSYKDWEWVILLNGDGLKADISFLTSDPRIKIYKTDIKNNIGALKKECCSKCEGQILAELDCDDILTEDCLGELYKVFLDENIQMAYSNSCEFNNDNWSPNVYSTAYGWIHRPFNFNGKELIEMVGWDPASQSFRRVEWAPNHIRAWRKSSYDEIGGHNPDIVMGDDHELCCRYYIKYGEKGIKHIDKCLYLYRVHKKNSCYVDNHIVQKQTDDNYLKYSREMAIRWAKDKKLRMIDLGGRFNALKGFETVDLMDADIICDLNGKWDFADDNSVGIIKASHIFEHLSNPIHTMNEAYRILAPGGWLFIEVPSTDGRGAFQDPTHRSFWNSNSIWYYTRESHARFIRPQYKGRFQLSRIVNWHPTEFERSHNIVICEVDLICLKDGYRHSGEILI